MIPKYYDQDGIVIYNCDCRDVLPYHPKIDLVLTDPPYKEGDFSWLLDYVSFRPLVVTPGKIKAFDWIQTEKPDWQYAWKCSGTSSLGGAFCLHILFEPILAYGRPFRPLGSDLLDYPLVVDPLANGHPWPKPLKLFEKLVSHFSNEGQTVLDPFMGSGTTLVAAKHLGRKAIGIEIEEKYCAIAVKRLAQGVLL